MYVCPSLDCCELAARKMAHTMRFEQARTASVLVHSTARGCVILFCLLPEISCAQRGCRRSHSRFSPAFDAHCDDATKFNFKPVVCVITGSGRPGAVRQAELEAAASRLGGTILGDSLGRAGPGKYSNHLRARRKHQNDCNRDRVGAAGSETNASKPEGRARGRFIARSELTIEAGVMTKPRQGEFTGVLQEAVAVNELILDEIAASKRGDLVRRIWI